MTSPAVAAVIAQWAASGVRTKEIAAILASELGRARPGDRVETAARTAARLGITPGMAVQARYHLTGLKLIRKRGGRYYVA